MEEVVVAAFDDHIDLRDGKLIASIIQGVMETAEPKLESNHVIVLEIDHTLIGLLEATRKHSLESWRVFNENISGNMHTSNDFTPRHIISLACCFEGGVGADILSGVKSNFKIGCWVDDDAWWLL